MLSSLPSQGLPTILHTDELEDHVVYVVRGQATARLGDGGERWARAGNRSTTRSSWSSGAPSSGLRLRLRSRSAGTQRLVGLPGVHVARRGPIDGHGADPVGMRIEDLPRRLVPSERLQQWEEGTGEDERMAGAAAVRGARDGCGLLTPGLDHQCRSPPPRRPAGRPAGWPPRRPGRRSTRAPCDRRLRSLAKFWILDHGDPGEVHLATHRVRRRADDHDALVESVRGAGLRDHVAEQG